MTKARSVLLLDGPRAGEWVDVPKGQYFFEWRVPVVPFDHTLFSGATYQLDAKIKCRVYEYGPFNRMMNAMNIWQVLKVSL